MMRELDSQMDRLRSGMLSSLMGRQFGEHAPRDEDEADGQKTPTGNTEEDADFQLALRLQREEFEEQCRERFAEPYMPSRPMIGRWASDDEDAQAGEGGSISDAGEPKDDAAPAVDKGKGKAVDKGKGKAVDKGKGKMKAVF
ncbi:hypothetical protein HYDPIDRAFT_107743 [Hydnomerulius pinastri MD-312]|nr:hypothetical protein HYDPIDRAFT_107743 [Hydnomerulius pinastri MD-312]